MKCGKCGSKELEFNFIVGKIFCKFCGFLFEENTLNPEILFDKQGITKKSVKGQFVRKSEKVLYSEKLPINSSNKNGFRRKISQMGNLLKLPSWHIEAAFHLFLFINQRGFLKNRKIEMLCISCLYAICRKNKTPHLLVDFSDITQIRANKIGLEFLRLRKQMNLSLPIIDPSLFVHRFATKLNLGVQRNIIVLTSLRLMARMKREWICTGRRPSGLCGAAILLATRIHKVKKSKQEISNLVRIGNFILGSRLKEIQKTSIGFLSKKEIDNGGGDDGDKDSLSDFYNRKLSRPPSRTMSLEKYSVKFQEKNYTKIKLPKKKKLKNLPLSKNSTGLKRAKMKEKTPPPKEESCFYVNSDFETFVKESIWFQSNSKFFLSQSVNARAQKERPFAFFGTNSKKI